MRKIWMVVLGCFLVFVLSAQIIPPVVEWKKNLGGDRNDYATSIIRSRDNGYIVLGTTYSNNGDVTGHHGSQDSSDAWVVKLNESGNIQWQRSLGGSRDDELKDVIELPNGDLICVGATSSENGDVSGLHTFSQNGIYYSFSDLWILKLTSTGQTIWSKVYGGTDPEKGVAIKKAVDGGYIIGGNAESNDFDVSGNHGWSDLWLLKIDDNGNKQWQKTYGNYNSQFVSNLVVTSDGNYLVTGWQQYKGFPPVFQVIYSYSRNTRLLVNSTGDIIWEYYPLFPELIPGRSDGYLGAVEMPSKQLMLINFEAEGSGMIDATSGWWRNQRVFPNTGQVISENYLRGDFWNIYTGYRGKYGQHASVLLSDSSILTCFRTVIPDAVLQRIHTDGPSLLFYMKEFGGSNIDGFSDMALLNDNELVAVGVTNSSDGDVPGNKGGDDLWVLKLNSVNTIKGNVFIDLNANGIKDANELAYANAKVQTSLGSKIVVGSTDSAGKFINFVDTIGTYSTTVLPFRPYYTIPVKQTIFTGFNQKDSFSLALVPIAGKKDLLINAIALDPTRGGFDFRYKITYSNIGTETINNCVVRLVRDKYLTYISSSPAYSGFVADTLQWNVGNLAPLSSSSIIVTFHVPPPASIALNTITSLFAIDPSAGDETPVDNSQLLVSGVTGSFDPNDKQEAKGGALTPEEFSAGEYLRYTIRFQNSGNDTAFNVSIRDTLTNRLDWNSFEMVGFSHPVHLKMENGRLTWTFKNILLPDSNRNEPLSHGYISYRIKPKAGLVVGDTIRNSASIYFDFNAPVKTNSQLTIIRAPLPPQPAVTGLLAAYCNNQGIQKGKITNLPAAASGITVTAKLDAAALTIAPDSTFSFDVSTLAVGTHTIAVSFTNASGTKSFNQSFNNTVAITPDVNMSANITNVISLTTPVIITATNATAGGTTPLYTFAKNRTFTTIVQAEGAGNVLNLDPATLAIGDNWIYTRMKSNASCITTQSVTDSIKIIRDQATGITDPDNPGKVINIYPNPFNKQLYISGLSSGKTYILYLTNLNGQLLQRKKITNRSNAELISQKEKAGTYLLSVYDEKKKVLLGSVKVIRQ